MVSFNNKIDDFHKILRERVNVYLSGPNSINEHSLILRKTVLFFGAYCFFYICYLSISSVYVSLGSILLLAICQVLMAINLGHEGLHHRFFKNKVLTKIFEFTYVLV